jgi:hypothetical protein
LESINNESFIQKYSSLYTNLETDKKSLYIYTALFCIRRLILSFTTIFGNEIIWVNILAYMVLSIVTIAFYIHYKPMISPALNKIELFNECFIYICSYFFLIYSDWFEDIEFRYDIGFGHMYCLIASVIVNLGFIGYEMFK